jgi:hypothetical protein
MEEDLGYFERSSPEDDTAPVNQEYVSADVQSPSGDLQTGFEEDHLRIEEGSGTNNPGPQIIDDVEPNCFIRTPTVTATLSHKTGNASIGVLIDTGQEKSLPRCQNPMALVFLASSISSSFSSQSYRFQDRISSVRAVQQNPHESILDGGMPETSILASKKHHLLKLFLEKMSLWIDQCQQHVVNFTKFSQPDLSHLTNSLGIELSFLARTCPPLLYSMLESAARQESMHATQSTLVIRRKFRTLALRHLESELCQSSAVLAAENLLGLSQLLTTEL